jgi:hypothetical protein
MREALPFALRGSDSDNGSEFINAQLHRYCQAEAIQCTRGRPYKQDDNAHVEQKNWTHVRKLLGDILYTSPEARDAMNDLYRNELRRFQNLFLPSVKLHRKVRIGSRIRSVYDRPQTPFERVLACSEADPLKVAQLQALRKQLDPFALAEAIDRKLTRLYVLAHHRARPQPIPKPPALTAVERQAVQALSEGYGIPVYVGTEGGLSKGRVTSHMARRLTSE